MNVDLEKKQLSTPTIGGMRASLGGVLPLDTPYLVQMFPCAACNFRCGYCIYALEPQARGKLSNQTLMDWTLFQKCIDDMRTFPRKLKMLRFAAIGEPLLHPRIADMVSYAVQAQVAESVDIVTNGSLLTHELSDALIAAGLSRLRISIEGLSGEEYQKNSNVTVDFQALVDQIGYFYRHCAGTSVYIKIIDYMVQDQAARERFYTLFQPICHYLAVEHLTPTVEEIDYDVLADGMCMDKPQNGDALLQAEICPQPFYMMQINPDGLVVPCCSMKYPTILGDVSRDTVPKVWNGAAYNAFRRGMLKDRTQVSAICGACSLYLYDLQPEDMLESARERLLVQYADPDESR